MSTLCSLARWPRRTLAALTAGLCMPVVACSFQQEGEPPGENVLYFPTVLALGRDADSGAPDYLYIVNSNFDRRFNAGSVQAIDLDALADAVVDVVEERNCSPIEDGCVILPVKSGDRRLGDPDHPLANRLHPVIADEVVIPSLGRGAALSADGQRLYVATAVDAGVTYIDLDKGSGGLSFECGQGNGRRCARDSIAGAEPADPVGLVVGPFADLSPGAGPAADPAPAHDYVLVVYRNGQLALFDDDGSGPPELSHSGKGLRGNLTGLAYDPATRLALVTSSGAGSETYLQRLGILANQGSALRTDPFFQPSLLLSGTGAARNTWAISVVPREDQDGLRQSTAFVVSRQPSALLRVELTEGMGEEVSVDRITPVGAGAARLALGTLTDEAGEATEIAVVSCFDERRVFVIETSTGQVLSVVSGFSGSFELAIDEARNLLYVLDFRASVMRIVSLAGLLEGVEARLVATLGEPSTVEELQ